jgi:LPPG:FO 2-phospho-L-lactate transferase
MIVSLAGGVGAAKFLQGLVNAMPPEELTIISNTGDDIELYGLHISPDIDIVAYTLSGFVDQTRGWGIREDTFDCLQMLRQYYAQETWFNLGDRDLATHIWRTQHLRDGYSLTDITHKMCRKLNLRASILPMCDQQVPSLVRTPDGVFHFQEYLVQRGGQEPVLEVIYQNIEHARPHPDVLTCIRQAEAIIICPSNPVISIGPILAVPGMRQALAASNAPVIAISPIIQGATLKGPADKMLAGLGFEVSARGVAQYYGNLLSAFIIDSLDVHLQPLIAALGLNVKNTNTIMQTISDKQALAQFTLDVLKAS